MSHLNNNSSQDIRSRYIEVLDDFVVDLQTLIEEEFGDQLTEEVLTSFVGAKHVVIGFHEQFKLVNECRYEIEYIYDLAVKNENEKTRDIYRRSFCRSVLSFFEGLSNLLIEFASASSKAFEVEFSNQDAGFLKKYSKFPDHWWDDDFGEGGRKGNKYPSAFSKIKIAIETFPYALRVERTEISSAEWGGVKAIIKIRNRITHPRGKDDLIINDDEFKLLWLAYHWFVSKYDEALNKFEEKFEDIEDYDF